MQPLAQKFTQPSKNADSWFSYRKEPFQSAPPLQLPTDYPRMSHTEYSAANLRLTLSATSTRALYVLTQKTGASVFTTWLASFAALLYRYTRQSDIILGASSNSCSGILPLHVSLCDDHGFGDVLHQVQSAGINHPSNHLPLQVARGSKETTFQILFLLGERKLWEAEICSQLVQPDLVLFAKEGHTALEMQWMYNCYLFNEATVYRMHQHFEVFLNSLVDTEQPITHLPLLGYAERTQVLYEWNHTNAAFPQHGIHELFVEQVKRAPQHTAVCFCEQQLTFQQLNDYANQLALHLKKLGVKNETLVPICIERSLEMVVAIVGVLKAGGAFVPIDPEYPLERVKHIVSDTAATILLTRRQSTLKPLYIDGVRIVDVDGICHQSDESQASGDETTFDPAQLAYVIYTSGSTGKPKGVMVEHKSVVNLVVSLANKIQFKADSSFLSVTTYCFDIFYFELFSSLIFGGKLVLLPKEDAKDGVKVVEQIAKHRPTHMQATPSAWQLLMEAEWKNSRDMKLLVGGEAITESLRDELVQQGMVFNVYGPTETTIWSSLKKLEPGEKISIGRPLGNTQLYILDQYQQPVPVGIAGELYIGGAGVARGYLNRPELTAEKFVLNPFRNDANARMYKTGDLARWLPDGNVIFLGRIDHQVKIRGHRIELGEIEAVLSQHPAVLQAIVINRQDGATTTRLVAYVVAEQTINPSKLNTFLRQKLPDYMIPSLFVFLKTVPLTPNGKIDRAALPAPERNHRTNDFQPPINTLQQELAGIFEKVLDIRPIGRSDNFFELGGDSLQAARLFSMIRKRFGRQLPLAILLQAPTVERLEKVLQQTHGHVTWSSLVPIQTQGSKTPLFCMHAGAGTVLFYHSLAQHLRTDQPIYGLQAKGLNGNEPPHTRIEQMATHYIKEIRTVQPQGPYYLLGYCFGAVVAFEMAQQLLAQGEHVALLASLNGVAPSYNDPLPAADADQPPSETNLLMREQQWQHFKLLSSTGKLLYALKVLKSKVWNYQMQARVRRWAYFYYILRNRPLPEALGKHYFLETNSRFVKAYQPKTYRGNMVVLYSPSIYHDPHLGWNSLIDGSIETSPIVGNHLTRRQIMEEPFVEVTAQKLKAHLPH